MPQQISDLRPFLDRLTSRSRLSEAEQQAVLDLPSHVIQVRANTDFVRLDQQVHEASIVLAGVVGRFGQTGEGAREITALHFAGDACDLHSVVLPKARSALQALTTSTIVRVPHAALRQLAARFTAVAEALWRDCMVDSAILSQWVINVGRRDARTRLAHLFCEVAARQGLAGQGAHVAFAFPLTQTHLADVTGLTSVHVNRTLKSLRDQGLLRLVGGQAHILDWNALAELGEFDPDYLQADLRPEEGLRIINAA